MKNIALTWWWTWWHIFPLVSIHNYLKNDSNLNFIWFWDEEWFEAEVAEKNNIPFEHIPSWKIRRYFDFRNFYEPLKNLTWIFFWIYYILKYRIDIVFSKGWYVALPLCIAAYILRKKIYIHESDTVSWVANKIIGKIATKVFYTFPHEGIEDERTFITWQILNPDLIDELKDLNVWQNPRLKVVVMWWSQGSTTIFNALLKLLPELEDIDFNVILWDKNLHLKDKFSKFQNVITYDFISQKKLWLLLKKTDIAITRWWATTLWELNMFWIHSIIIPLLWSAWNHQMKNAMYFKENFWSDVLNEEEDLEAELYRRIQKYKWLRKSWLNLDWFFRALQIIEKEIK